MSLKTVLTAFFLAVLGVGALPAQAAKFEVVQDMVVLDDFEGCSGSYDWEAGMCGWRALTPEALIDSDIRSEIDGVGDKGTILPYRGNQLLSVKGSPWSWTVPGEPIGTTIVAESLFANPLVYDPKKDFGVVVPFATAHAATSGYYPFVCMDAIIALPLASGGSKYAPQHEYVFEECEIMNGPVGAWGEVALPFWDAFDDPMNIVVGARLTVQFYDPWAGLYGMDGGEVAIDAITVSEIKERSKVPEPGTPTLFLVGILFAALIRRKVTAAMM